MLLNAFLMHTGHHEASWRHSDSSALSLFDLPYYAEQARVAEEGCLDAIFMSDSLNLSGALLDSTDPAGNSAHRPAGSLDPFVLLSALSVVTKNIGLIGTASTSFDQPFNLARKLASLDHISGGRAGWNVVTTATESAARNFGGLGLPPHDARYEIADESLTVCKQLWESWELDSLVADKNVGIWAASGKINAIAHHGKYFDVSGPLNMPRCPQGRPLLVQAGSSPRGMDFAAVHADAVFTAQTRAESATRFARDMRRRAAVRGRRIQVMPGVVTIVGDSAKDARAKMDELDGLIHWEKAMDNLAMLLGVPASQLSLDCELPAELPDPSTVEGSRSRRDLVVEMARSERLTVRSLLRRLGPGRGHPVVCGTGEVVADELQSWVTIGAADGFNVMPALLPSGLTDFVEKVVPVLRDRGAVKSRYTEHLLRERYERSSGIAGGEAVG